MTDLLLSQLTDPFRIVMLIALVYVWHRNRANTPGPLPLVLGAAFVAVLLPLTTAAPAAAPLPAMGLGLVANAVILGVVLAGRALWLRRPGG